MTETERQQQGIMDGARLSAFSKEIKKYVRKWGVTPFGGFVDGKVNIRNQSYNGSVSFENIIYVKEEGKFFYRSGSTGEGSLGTSAVFYSNWDNKQEYAGTSGDNEFTFQDRFFASVGGYIINGVVVDIKNQYDSADIQYQLEHIMNDLLPDKVDKEEGKGLSSNDFTDEFIAKITDTAAKALVNEADIKGLDARISSLETTGLKRQIVSSLPTTGDYENGEIPQNIIFMIPVRDKNGDYYNEYMWTGSTYELIGSSQTSLDGYTTTAEQNRLIASTVGLTVGTAVSVTLKAGDKVRIVSTSGASVSTTQTAVKITDVVAQGAMNTFTDLKYGEVKTLTKDGSLIMGVNGVIATGTKFFITNNAVTNVGLPHLTDSDVTTIFNNATAF